MCVAGCYKVQVSGKSAVIFTSNEVSNVYNKGTLYGIANWLRTSLLARPAVSGAHQGWHFRNNKINSLIKSYVQVTVMITYKENDRR